MQKNTGGPLAEEFRVTYIFPLHQAEALWKRLRSEQASLGRKPGFLLKLKGLGGWFETKSRDGGSRVLHEMDQRLKALEVVIDAKSDYLQLIEFFVPFGKAEILRRLLRQCVHLKDVTKLKKPGLPKLKVKPLDPVLNGNGSVHKQSVQA